jgi:hypothetical protein
LSRGNCWAIGVAGVQDVIVYIGGHPRFCSPTPPLLPNLVAWNSTCSTITKYDNYPRIIYIWISCQYFICPPILTLLRFNLFIEARCLYRESVLGNEYQRSIGFPTSYLVHSECHSSVLLMTAQTHLFRGSLSTYIFIEGRTLSSHFITVCSATHLDNLFTIFHIASVPSDPA